MNNELNNISIFEYDDYRAYLRDLYEHLKKTGTHFSYRSFSSKAGFRSPNILKLVIDGKRNLSPQSVQKFARALNLKKDEAEFFRILVNLNQAGSVDAVIVSVSPLSSWAAAVYVYGAASVAVVTGALVKPGATLGTLKVMTVVLFSASRSPAAEMKAVLV